MARHSADGDGMALSLTDLVVDLADVLGLPSGVVPVADDDTSSLDVPPLRYGIPWGCSAMLREKPT